MSQRKLTHNERETLQELAKHQRDAQVVRRAQALLWHDAGEAVSAIAERLHVTRQTIYSWLKMVYQRQTDGILKRLQDGPRTGRRPTQRQRIEALVQRLWERPNTKM